MDFTEKANAFKKDLQSFIEEANQDTLKSMYYTLLKKYHPDLNPLDSQYYNNCTLILNHVYAEIINKPLQKNIKLSKKDEYDKFLINGTYTYKNRDNRTEKVTDKSLFLYKMGLDKILGARDFLCNHPLSDGYGSEILIKASEDLYLAIKYLNDSIKIGKNNNWLQEAKDKIEWAYRMNSRISKQLINNHEKNLSII